MGYREDLPRPNGNGKNHEMLRLEDSSYLVGEGQGGKQKNFLLSGVLAKWMSRAPREGVGHGSRKGPGWDVYRHTEGVGEEAVCGMAGERSPAAGE